MRYATPLDVMFMIVGSIGAVLHGIALPLVMIVFGDMLDSFLDVSKFCDICENNRSKPLVELFNNQSNRDKNWNCDLLFSTKEEDQKWNQ